MSGSLPRLGGWRRRRRRQPFSTRAPSAGLVAALVRQVPGLRLVRHARRGAASRCDARDDGAPDAPPRRGRGGRGGPDPDRRRTSSTACSVAGSCPASLVLVGGEPGVGKSTLLLMALRAMGVDRRVLLVTGEESAAQVKLRADRLGGGGNDRDPRRDRARDRLRDARAERPDVCVIDSVQTLYSAELGSAPGSVGAGARGGRPPAARREGGRCGRLPRRPRDEGRRRGRPARARAPRRLRAPVRGRPLPRAPHPARGQESLRLDERDRRLRDDRGRARRRSRSVGALRPRRSRRDRLGRRVHARGDAADPARDPGARVADRSRHAATRRHRRRPQAARDDRRGALAPRAHSRSARPTCSCNVAGGVRIDEPGADLAVASRSPRRLAAPRCARGSPRSARSGSPAACDP